MLDYFYHILIQVTNYEICNNLCLNKLINLHVFKQRLQLLLCVDIIVNKHQNKHN